MARCLLQNLVVIFTFIVNAPIRADEPAQVDFLTEAGKIIVRIDRRPVAEYVLGDMATPRPYFAHLRTASGLQITRNHPPQPGDLQDHDAFHPGLWLAFGDLNGSDNWRCKAKVTHERFLEAPQGSAGHGGFTSENTYRDESDHGTHCRETRRIDVHVVPAGWLLSWDSTFSSDRGEFVFGDQEEMGLGLRMATPLAVVTNHGGQIRDSEGRQNERQIWGTSAAWCDYSGPCQDRWVGVTLFSHPQNFRRSWHHVRDYGLLVANPFGRNALTGGSISRLVIKPGESLRIRFGILVHESETSTRFSPADAMQDYERLCGSKDAPR